MRRLITHTRAIRGTGVAVLLAVALGCASSGPSEQVLRDRKQARALYNIGVDHMQQGRAAMALRELLKAEEFNASDPWIQLAIAEAYRRKGHPLKAVEHLEAALVINPSMHSARLNLSGVYIQLERYEMAAAEAQILVDDPLYATPWTALTNLGWSQYRLGRNEGARESLELAIDYHSRYWPAILNLGILENAEGRRLEGMALFNRILELEPKVSPVARAEANYRIAEIYIALGQQDRAVEYLTAAVERKPNGKWGRKSEDYLKMLR